jgi:ribosomal protein L37AE/L43A
MTTPTRAMPVQYGTAESADFEAMTWTFRMPEGFKVAAGNFAILPRIEYDISTSLPRSDFYALQDDNARLRAANAALTEVLKGALYEYDGNVCTHESTHRGGAIWTICDWCGAKWADDEGGFVPYTDPPRIVAARAALASVEAPK